MKRAAKPRVAKIAISLPLALYRAAERARKEGGQNRSEFFRGAVDGVIRTKSRIARKGTAGQSSSRGSARDLLRFAGVLDPRDADEMRKAIERGCERVVAGDW